MDTNEIILRVKVPQGWDNKKFAEDIGGGRPVSFADCNIEFVTDIFTSFRDEVLAGITHDGLSNLLRRQLLLEDFVQLGQPQNFVETIMIKFLREVGVDGELIVVDPYFFAPTSESDYPHLVESIIRPFSQALSTIYIVTRPNKVNPRLKQEIKNVIQNMNASIQLIHTTSSNYHDRFWISANRSKGILTGTSLNGLGKRYAIIDRLASSDVAEIVKSLKNENLI
jgi:hypothetical protein